MAITLRAFAVEDIPAILAGSADWQSLAPTGAPYWRPRAAAEIRRKVESMAGPGLAPEYNFVIDVGGTAVGECSVHGIDYRNRVGQVGLCIWDHEHRRRGHGHSAVSQLLDWAAGNLGLHRLEAWINSGNEASELLFAGLGFRHEGTLRERYLSGGVRRDVMVWGYVAGALVVAPRAAQQSKGPDRPLPDHC